MVGGDIDDFYVDELSEFTKYGKWKLEEQSGLSWAEVQQWVGVGRRSSCARVEDEILL